MDMIKNYKKPIISFLAAVSVPLLLAVLLKIPEDITISFPRIFYLLFCGPLAILDLLSISMPPLLVQCVLIIGRVTIQWYMSKIKTKYIFVNIVFIIIWTGLGLLVVAFFYQSA
jgi:hypothetical protein